MLALLSFFPLRRKERYKFSTNEVDDKEGAMVAGVEFSVGDDNDGSEQEAFFDAAVVAASAADAEDAAL